MTAQSTEDLIIKALPLVTAEEIQIHGDFEHALIQKVWELEDLTREGSRVAKGVANIARYSDPDNKDFKMFTGIVKRLVIDKATTRVKVDLFTNIAERRQDGMEHVYTERTDHADGLAVANMAKKLKGHKVMVYMEIESFVSNGETKKMRVARRFKDLGLAPE